MKHSIIIIFAATLLAFMSCEQEEKTKSRFLLMMEKELPGELSVAYPFEGSVFPANFPEPTIMWEDPNLKSKQWVVHLGTSNPEIHYSEITESLSWKVPADIWNKLKTTQTGDVKVVIAGINPEEKNKLQTGSSVRFSISKDSLNTPIFYRAVPLPFKFATSHLDSIKYMLGDVSSNQPPKTLMENLPVCGNCHSFSPDGKKFAMDVDAFGDKGSYLIADIEQEVEMKPEKFITWSDFQEKPTMALLSHISPNGKHVISTLDDNEIFESREELEYSQLFFPIKGILTTYDIEKKTFSALKGADDTMYVQSNSQWSPDSKTVYFARSKALQREQSGMTHGTGIYDMNKFQAVRDSFLRGKKHFKFDLMKLPFNEGKGGDPKYINGASQNGKSNYFPKISPNGKWMVFCQANNYMLLQPDSKLYIMPTDGSAKPREMNCNTSNMNSWHSWSPDGKWLVFSTKYFGAYTQLFLTRIDENGNDSPPVWLEYFKVDDRAANIPEFVNVEFGYWDKITDKFSHVADYNVRGTSKAQFGDFQNAIVDFNKAIQINKKDHQAFANRGKAKDELGDLQGALSDLTKAIELDPENHDYYIHRGNTKLKMKDIAGAIQDCSKSIKLQPEDAALYAHRAGVYQKTGELENALEDLSTAIRLSPSYALYYVHKAAILNQQGKIGLAIREMDDALSHEPLNVSYLIVRGKYYLLSNQIQKAIADFEQSVSINPQYHEAYEQLAIVNERQNKLDKALAYYNKAVAFCDKEANREYAALLNNRGTVLGKLKKYESAVEDFTRALAFYGDFTDAYCNRAYAYYHLGHYKQAAEDCNVALQIEPGFRKAQMIKDMIGKKE